VSEASGFEKQSEDFKFEKQSKNVKARTPAWHLK